MSNKKDIQIMTHQILGYPSFDINEKAVNAFYKSGVDFVELQIPFSDPMSDGPLFALANQRAIESGVTIRKCLEFIEKIARTYPIPFLIMTYYNIIYKYGVERFIKKCSEINLYGLIVPDAPFDDAKELFDAGRAAGINIIPLATAYTDEERFKQIVGAGSGFLYFVPRKGVTGSKTSFDAEVINSIKRAKEMAQMPVAVGFGIQSREDVNKIVGAADIAVVGSKILKVIEESGIDALDGFLKQIVTKSIVG